MNLVLLTGRLGAEPTIKEFENGKVVSFPLATSDGYKNKEGENIQTTTWHNIVGSGKIADVVEKYLTKGSLIAVQGKLQNRSYENKDGVKVYITEIRISKVEFLDTKSEQSSETTASIPANQNPIIKDEEDDDLPF